MNVLFVCRGNLQRSPTAEDMLVDRASGKLKVKSAGVNRTARTRVDRNLLEWADRVYVMMEGIRKRIEEEFPEISKRKDIRVFGIQDRYRRGEARLKRRLIEEFLNDDFLSKYVSEEDLEDLKGGRENQNVDMF